MFLLIRILILLDQGSTLMTSFNLDYFLGGSISKYSHTGGLRLQHISFGLTQTVYDTSLTENVLRAIKMFIKLKVQIIKVAGCRLK